MEVHVALSFKELNNKFEVNTSSAEDDLVAKGRSSTNDNKWGKMKSKSRSKNGGNTAPIMFSLQKGKTHNKTLLERQKKKATNLDRLLNDYE